MERKLSFEHFCKDLAEQKLDDNDIGLFRNTIKETIEKRVKVPITIANFAKILTPGIFSYMLELYDIYFFDNLLIKFVKDNKCSITVCFGSRCSSVAGRCFIDLKKKCFSIELAPITFGKAFVNSVEHDTGGITCVELLDCIMITFEHELVHALCGCFCENNCNVNTFYGEWECKNLSRNGHGKTFMSILNNTFGHTDYTHGLFGRSKNSKLSNQVSKSILKIGDMITFEGRLRTGNKLNKRVSIISAKLAKINRSKVEVLVGEELTKWSIPLSSVLTINGIETEFLLYPERSESSNNKLDKPKTLKIKKILETAKPKIGNKPKTLKIKETKVSLLPVIQSPESPINNTYNSNNSIDPFDLPNNLSKNSVIPSNKYGSKKDRKGKTHKSKYIVDGECIFPFKFRKKVYHDCLDTGNGPWCPTKLKDDRLVDTWGYCL